MKFIPKMTQESAFGLRQSALKSTIATTPCINPIQGVVASCAYRRFEGAFTQPKCRFLSYLRYIWLFALFSFLGVYGENHRLVFVHIGDKLPSHLHHSMAQARLFNPDCDLVLLGNGSALS